MNAPPVQRVLPLLQKIAADDKKTFFWEKVEAFPRNSLDKASEKSKLCALLTTQQKTTQRRKEKEDMIKTITIILGLAAGVATANSLPPTPEAPITVELR